MFRSLRLRSPWSAIAFLVMTILSLTQPLYSKDATIEIEDISALLLDWRMSAQDKISDEIFDAIGTQSFKIDLNEHMTAHTKMQRRYFDNGDGSFTIFDTLDVQGRVAYSPTLAQAIGLSFSVGAEKGYRFGHSQTVNSNDELIKHEKWKAEQKTKSTEDKVIDVISPHNWFGLKFIAEGSGYLLDEIAMFIGVLPKDRDRYAGLWQVVSIPFDIPWTADKLLKNAKIGELFSYTRYHGVFSSLGISTPGGLTTSHSVGGYVRGDYRITVLKSQNSQAKIKAQKIFTSSTPKQSSGKLPLFDFEITVFDLSTDINISKKPYQIKLTKTKSDALDEAYEYDLNSPDGKKAYNLAIQGDFITSAQYAEKNRGVKKIFEDKVHAESNLSKSEFDLFVWKTSFESGVTHRWHDYKTPHAHAPFFESYLENHASQRNIITNQDQITFSSHGVVPKNAQGIEFSPTLQFHTHFHSDKTLGYEVQDILLSFPNLEINRAYETFVHDFSFGSMTIDYFIVFSHDALNKIVNATDKLIDICMDSVFNDETVYINKSLEETVYVTMGQEKVLSIFLAKEKSDLAIALKNARWQLKKLKSMETWQERMISLAHVFSYGCIQLKLLQVIKYLAFEEAIFERISLRSHRFSPVVATWGDPIPKLAPLEELQDIEQNFEEGARNLQNSKNNVRN